MAGIARWLWPVRLEDFTYAPWMVANLTLSQLPAGRGQELAWDNVVFDGDLLGYVDATHQSIEVNRRRTVITYYWPLSHRSPATARKVATGRSLEEWQGDILRDLLRVHPELAEAVENIDVRIWGHAMIRPTLGAGASIRPPFTAPPSSRCFIGIHTCPDLLFGSRSETSSRCQRCYGVSRCLCISL